MNLHSIVRGAITTVNPDQLITYMRSTGFTVDDTGQQTPTYDTFTGEGAQIQAVSGKDLAHLNNLNIQGVVRAVYMYGNTNGVVRPNARGGDLLVFPQFIGDAPQTWLVVTVPESWGTVGQGGWSKVIVCLQQ